jgi:ribosome-associated translation inhibitor RaiA
MNAPVEILFHGIDRSEAVEERVREKVAKLAKHFDRLTHCRVVLEAPHRSPQKPKVYQIKIELGMPGRRPIVVSHEREGSHAGEELNLALRDAFEAALRRVDGMRSKIGQRAKLERGRRRPQADAAERD